MVFPTKSVHTPHTRDSQTQFLRRLSHGGKTHLDMVKEGIRDSGQEGQEGKVQAFGPKPGE